ncbi:uncharacterized protein LOC121428215 [Lytechinus variegatus]|uniref:uncharacterized protein LOC121428215 n=1 Tax=Lytechinus variegatus TaxID=7654 RepID=UPI001BB19AF0|nr:uncharacterized protein LOC121428215 [Lytechinus variegatus]
MLTWLLVDFCLAAITPHPRHHHRRHHGNHTTASGTEVVTGTVLASSMISGTDKDVDVVEYGIGGTSPSSTSTSTESRGSTHTGSTIGTEDMMADDWRLHTTENGEVVLVTDEHQANVILNPASRIQLGTVTFTSTGAIKGEKGETGRQGYEGRRGARGIPGPPGIKGEPGDQITFNGPLHVNFATTSDTCVQSDTGRVRIDEIGESLEICTGRGWRNLGIGNKPRLLRRSCMELLLIDGIVEDGIYWINPSYGKDTQHAVRVYCDMSTAGGGWSLVAKVTDSFRWICPELDGADCESSSVDPGRANLFHRVHERDLVDLTAGTGSDTGVHVDNSVSRYIFKTGRKQIRFSFVSDASVGNGWNFSEDGYASFRQDVEHVIFKDGTWGLYSRENLSYSWNIITHQRTQFSFTGDVICWGNRVVTPYRYHEGGLHMGIPSSSLPCQLDIDPEAVMLKSIYAAMGENGNSQWVDRQRSYLGDGSMAAANERVAIWVR